MCPRREQTVEIVKWKDVLGRGDLLMGGKGDDVFHVIPSEHDNM